MRIIISRTDNIGDVVLTLPLTGIIKQLFPHSHIYFLAQHYVAPIVAACPHVDTFLDWSELSTLAPTDAISIFREINPDTILHVFPDQTIAQYAKAAKIKQRIGTRNRWFHWFLLQSIN